MNPSFAHPEITILCHTSPLIGLGHVRRCAILQQGIERHLRRPVALCVQGKRTRVMSESSITWLEHFSDFESWFPAETKSKQVLILDFHPEFIEQQKLRSWCVRFKAHGDHVLICMDKLRFLSSIADLHFIPSFFNADPSPKSVFGWDHFLLPEYSAPKKDEVLVLSGGTDSLHLADRLPDLLEAHVPEQFPIHWITGPFAKAPDLPASWSRWTIHRNPNDLDSRIAQAKVIISTYGVSFFEALKSGAVTFLIEPSKLCDSQELEALSNFHTSFIINHLKQSQQLLKRAFADLDTYQKKFSLRNQKRFGSQGGAFILAQYIQNRTGQKDDV